jgi:hypothetical protein
MSRPLLLLTAIAFCLSWTLPSRAAGLLPQQSDICDAVPDAHTDVNASKKLVANYLLVGNTYGIKRAFGGPEQWRLIFTQAPGEFCSSNLVCPRGTREDICTKTIETCKRSKFDAVNLAQEFFDAMKTENSSTNASFKLNSTLANSATQEQTYFATATDDASLRCVMPEKPKPPPPPAVADKSRIRLRGVSDDLYIDRNRPEFKSTSQAAVTVSGDHSVSTTQTQTTKIKGAVGYAFEPGGHTAVIPYISFYQSLTDVTGKPQTTDPTSNVAGGLLFSTTKESGHFENVISAKPQFLDNTKDGSQIGSLRLMYTPYTTFDVSGGGLNLNNLRPIDILGSKGYAQIQVDLRADVGQYANIGNDPVQRLLNKDFTRAGSRFGFAFMTDPVSPSLTLVVAETLLYGFTGLVRNFDLFETSLTYNLDPKTNYLGLSATYRKGRDEDTALRVQTWLLGLTARY